MIAIIDYGMGNLRSVHRAFEVAGAKAKITSSPKDLKRAEHIILPGVGAFGAAMKELRRRGLTQPIKDAITDGKRFLGLCLGLQLLFEDSDEAPGVRGLGVLRGEVKRFKFTRDVRETRDDCLKVPHMGWNTIVHRPSSIVNRSSILDGVPSGAFVYFVHSYYIKPKDKSVVLTTTNYGVDFVSGICRDNIYGFQFHPEKSQEIGLKIIRNFARLRV